MGISWDNIRNILQILSDKLLHAYNTILHISKTHKTHVALIGLMVAVLGIVLMIYHRRRDKVSKQKKEKQYQEYLFRIYNSKDIDISRFVGAVKPPNITVYLPVAEDKIIATALKCGEEVLILGRPGIGKSHTVIHHISQVSKWYRRWYVIEPPKQGIQKLRFIRIKRRRYILLLDDVNEYIWQLEKGESILDLIAHLKACSKKLVVIATMRTTVPEFSNLGCDAKLLGRWKHINLPDWHLDKGKELAALSGRNLDSWDGTPLSVKQPSLEMFHKYQEASQAEKAVLRCLKILRDFGIKPASKIIV